MIQVNKFIEDLKPSSTLAINQKVQELRHNGNSVFHFGFGQSPFPIHNSITAALTEHVKDNSYLPTIGLEPLRKQISVFLKRHQGIESNKDYIFIGPGSKELLYQTIMILDGVFLIPKGSWVSYLPQIKSKNGQYHILETSIKDEFKLSPEELDAFCNRDRNSQKTLILNSPNNPTGAVYKEEELEDLAVICKKHNVIVMSDEIYSQVNFNTEFSPSISKYYPEKTIVFGGLSKVFSAGGYRLGFMALPKDLWCLKSMYRSLFSETFSAVAAPIQHASIAAYEYDLSLKNYITNCSSVLKLIAEFVYNQLVSSGLECTAPQGAFYMMIGFNSFQNKFKNIGITTSDDLSEYLLNNYGVALLPGTDFYFQKHELFFRLAFVDFDGESVINSYANFDGTDEEFVITNCSSIYRGVAQIIQCVKDL